jgi:hypothetical protein
METSRSARQRRKSVDVLECARAARVPDVVKLWPTGGSATTEIVL